MNCLLLIDIQNDFLAGGQLAVPDSNSLVPLANSLMNSFPLVIATQNWHPVDHVCFASNHPGKSVGDLVQLNGVNQRLQPDHCVQHTAGADLAAGLNLDAIDMIVQKGTDKFVESYSGFYDGQQRKKTNLADQLNRQNVSQVFIVGLTTEDCVKFTALDAVALGFNPVVVEDACRGRNQHDVENAIDFMRSSGVQVLDMQTAWSLLARFS